MKTESMTPEFVCKSSAFEGDLTPKSIHRVHKRCGSKQCWCAKADRGHGPYTVLCGRDHYGRRRQVYLSTATEVESWAAEIEDCRRRKPRSTPGRRRERYRRPEVFNTILNWLGAYVDRGRIRELRGFPRELRWRRRYTLLSPKWRRMISEDEFVAMCHREITARKRTNRYGRPWFADNFWTQELEQAVTHQIDQTKINRTADRVCGDRGSLEK
ncbi:MAG: hypothetical protein QGF59_23355 [Pirellulaceae bacterium]|nr:hypothetical protein [Pirellulaceae bacterium]